MIGSVLLITFCVYGIQVAGKIGSSERLRRDLVAGVPAAGEIAGLGRVVLVLSDVAAVRGVFHACCICGLTSATIWPWYCCKGCIATFWANP